MSLIPRSTTYARRKLLPLTAALLVIIDASPSVRARPTAPQSPEGEMRGIPWTGEPGIKETVAEIMARARREPKADLSQPREAKRESSEFRKQQLLERNPGALATARWPIARRALAGPRPAGRYNPQTVGTSFLAAQLSDSGFIPPDSMGDVGPTQILVIINGRIRVFDKAGVLGGLNVSTNTFFSSVTGGLSTTDPHVRYDRLSQRWFITMINVPSMGPNRAMIAVSSGPTITNSSSFTFFQFQVDAPLPAGDTNGFADYDTLGVDKFALYIGVNMFDQAGTTFMGTTGFVVNKANLISVSPSLTVTAFRQMAGNICPGSGPYTPQGVNNDDPSATEGYFIGVDLCSFGLLQIRRVVDPGGTPTLSGNLGVSVPLTYFPIDQVQPGTSAVLDALDDRLFAAAVHKNKSTGASTLWTAHNMQVDASGGAVQCGVPSDLTFPLCPGGRNASRWYEVGSLTTTPALVQAGTLFDSTSTNPLGYWIPSVAMSGQGHMAIGTSRAGASVTNGYASVAVAGRLRTDALGTTQTPAVAQSSSSPYDVGMASPRRWGDYSQVGVDPTDDMTMWTFQEYAIPPPNPPPPNGAYAVRAIKLVAPPPAVLASANPPTALTGQSSVSVVVTGTSSAGSEFFDPGPDTGGPGFTKHITASITGGVVVNSITFNSPTQVTLNISTVGATNGGQTITITNPDGQSRASFPAIFTVYTNQQTQPMYRLYSPITLEHLYTTDYNEYTVLGPRGWNQEGIAYQIFANTTPYLGVTPIALYRLYNPGILQHLWTTDANEKNVLAAGGSWTYEGIAGYLLPTPVTGSTPLYRMALANPPLHLWTSDLNEYTVLQTRGWIPEGIIGHVIP